MKSLQLKVKQKRKFKVTTDSNHKLPVATNVLNRLRALMMAVNLRKPPPGLIHHSDRGSQYASHDYQKLLKQHGMICKNS